VASAKEYLTFILDQLSGLEGISHRPMMGEYLLYCRGTLIGGIYDDRLLLKPTRAAADLLPRPLLVSPYPGAKEMLLVEEVEDRELLSELIAATADALTKQKKG